MRDRLIALGLLVALTGCSAASTAYVAIPAKGQSQAQLASDTEACEATAKAYKDEHAAGAAIAAGFLGMATNHNAYQRKYAECMTLRGYSFKD